MDATRCPACARDLPPGDAFCIHCGARLADPAPPSSAVATEAPAQAGRRRPGLAAFLSLNLPGLGQAYNGQWLRGLVSMAVALGLLGLGLYLPLRGLFDGPERWRLVSMGLLALAALSIHVAASVRQAYRFAAEHPVRPPASDGGDGAVAAVVAVIAVELLALVAVNGVFLYLAAS